MTTTSTVRTGERRATHPARVAATVVAAVFLVVGIAGFIPGVTTNLGDIRWAGHESGAELFGIFQVSVLHNVVHLLFGVVGLVMARRATSATTYLIAGGVVYLVLALYGALIDLGRDVNVVPVDHADNWLHLVLGLGMIALGLVTRPRDRGTAEFWRDR